jgi:adenylosuccinate lyase
MLGHLSAKLPMSRWQRDLTDSTVLRSLGSAIGHCSIGWQSLHKGLGKLAVNQTAIERDLQQSWEVLAEAVQTVMRCHGLPEPYEQLKQLTRGQGITEASLRDFISKLDLPDVDKQRLLALTPTTYTGLAEQLAQLLPKFT